MNEAIKLARQNGWYGDIEVGEIEDGDGHGYEVYEIAILDPLFWQALGHALGWYAEVSSAGTRKEQSFPEYYKHETKKIDRAWKKVVKQPEWLYHWHRFINALSEGVSPDQFFKELITPTKGEE